ncbi:beta-lactamase/transpeptidase-like protein [Daldinia caldariorum]|uniref:beta-lactamase/transpeptidase-like protein n=1 Tax=Daldinia caldariorum TaxID=326644 RepID=UPI0020077E89|nr:beta-lactamase/transpeptidase-like protein [Daldinia caldariorum]KAI1463909.1 beta-lactamase/transpeptidase-like protein [Daldinia caldariorum]
MTQDIGKIYEDAITSGLLPGISVFAGDKEGNIVYSKSFGKASLKKGTNLPFTENTLCGIASMSKLMTAVAVLQCVQDGTLDLDKDVKQLLPEIGKYGIITGFDDNKNTAILTPNTIPITLRMLLTHTSGHEYDWFNPWLIKWRASRGEKPLSGPDAEYIATLPLVYPPGTGFSYGTGFEWAGKAVEAVTHLSLDEFMRERIWKPLGIEDDASFFPRVRDGMKDRVADLSTLNEKGEPPAVDASDFSMTGGASDCLGGAGVFATPRAYYTFLSAVFQRDPKILSPTSYEELFRPQLNETLEQCLNDDIASSPEKTQYLGLQIPLSIRKNWSFAGLVVKEGHEGWFAPNTVFWGGFPSCMWFIDHETGICGTAVCQIIPAMHPKVIALYGEFQKAIFNLVKTKMD